MAKAAARVEQSNIWWIFLLEGIAALIFGGLLLTAPAATLLALAIFLGFYLLFVAFWSWCGSSSTAPSPGSGRF